MNVYWIQIVKMKEIYFKYKSENGAPDPNLAALLAEAIMNQRRWQLFDFSKPDKPMIKADKEGYLGTDLALKVI